MLSDCSRGADVGHVSPLADRIDTIRNTILANADASNWIVDHEQLDDRHIIRRMVLKRCVYGVDKNTMAVELAKVALWLHSFTVGAPLSFLDHHLRCGDSLFGSWVKTGIEKAAQYGSPLLLHEPIKTALGSAASMQTIEQLPDAEIAEARHSLEIFEGVRVMTAPLNSFLSMIHAFSWLNLRGSENTSAIQGYFDGSFGDPFEIAIGKREPTTTNVHGQRFAGILAQARELIAEEKFMSWQVSFPGVWSDWEADTLTGGFDAVIGNPPWDRMKLQQVEWFAARKPDISFAQRAADRKRMIQQLEEDGDPLASDYAKASGRAEAGVRMARESGDYPLLSGGDLNIYSLFVERAFQLVKPEGMVGLLTPSGIASDLTASKFFKSVATQGRLKALYDFENKGDGRPLYFPDVHPQFKFVALIAAPQTLRVNAKCGFFLNDTSELSDPNRCFELTASDFARVNPNTGTAPIFRSRRDADLTTKIYARLPVLVDRSGDEEVKTWPIKYVRMLDMTNDSGRFRTLHELTEKEQAYPVSGNRYKSASGDWVPLYEGKMIWHFDHRASSIIVNPENQHRPAYPEATTPIEHANPDFAPRPQFWVQASEPKKLDVPVLAFRDVTNPTDHRTMDASFIPYHYAGNTLPLLIAEQGNASDMAPLAANLNAIVLDYVSRQKVQKNHLNWYIVEQLPVVPHDIFETTKFGSKTAGEIVREAVLELTYTAHDMAAFARDMGYVKKSGEAKPPFKWDGNRRMHLRAKLDALFFHLYGVTDRDDVRHVYSTFPIVERNDIAAHDRYMSRDLCLAYMSALAAGDPDAEISL